MGAMKDSMKTVEMSEQEIDALKTVIDELDLSNEDKAAITYGLNLIGWLPKLILEQRISLHRLQLMLFGKAAPAKKPASSKDKNTDNNNRSKDNETHSDNDTSANDEDLDITAASDLDNESEKSGRTGRKPHTDYKAADHFIPHEELKSGDLCPEKCGGKIYDFEPQTIIRIDVRAWLVKAKTVPLKGFSCRWFKHSPFRPHIPLRKSTGSTASSNLCCGVSCNISYQQSSELKS